MLPDSTFIPKIGHLNRKKIGQVFNRKTQQVTNAAERLLSYNGNVARNAAVTLSITTKSRYASSAVNLTSYNFGHILLSTTYNNPARLINHGLAGALYYPTPQGERR
jgi:hypothetical protein